MLLPVLQAQDLNYKLYFEVNNNQGISYFLKPGLAHFGMSLKKLLTHTIVMK